MIKETELVEALSYRKNGLDYVLKANLSNRWFACSKGVIDKLRETKNEFHIVIYWNYGNSVKYYKIPFVDISRLFTDNHLTKSKDDSNKRWNFVIIDDILSVIPKSHDCSVNISMFLNNDFDAIEPCVESYSEGGKFYKQHLLVERNATFIKDFKTHKKSMDLKLRCEICNFSFAEKYGSIGDGYIEAHHIVPLSSSKAKVENKFEDLILVCANCHRMLHRVKETLNISELRSALGKNNHDLPEKKC